MFSRSNVTRSNHADTEPADIWFEAGMIHFQDPRDPNELATCTLSHFEDYIRGTLCEYVDDTEMIKHFVCGRQAVRRFISDALALIEEVRPQLHVGLPLEVIAEVFRASVTRNSGWPNTSTNASTQQPSSQPLSGFIQRQSGLLVPS